MKLIKGLGQAPRVVNENISTAYSSSSTFSASRDSFLFISRLFMNYFLLFRGEKCCTDALEVKLYYNIGSAFQCLNSLWWTLSEMQTF